MTFSARKVDLMDIPAQIGEIIFLISLRAALSAFFIYWF